MWEVAKAIGFVSSGFALARGPYATYGYVFQLSGLTYLAVGIGLVLIAYSQQRKSC